MTLTTLLRFKSDIDNLRHQLDIYSSREIRLARDEMESLTSRHKRRNRCFHKLAELDRQFNLCKNVDTYLDLCGGPGQFAKYMHSVNLNCRGYGVTLRNSPCDYTFAHPNFSKIYGRDNTGDIFDEYVRFEIKLLCENNCDLILADGAFDVAGRENYQEKLTLPLIQKEIDIIYMCLKPGGSCIIKIFDTYEAKTARALNDFVSHFAEHTVYKPPSSRPANSEKYLVCQVFDKNTPKTKITAKLNIAKFATKQKKALQRLIGIIKSKKVQT
ncbi:Methyltransferase 1 [Perigonia lusca single nucleopolyhedrovirus]|uniref:Methyltransferase 1 n=1 Tax=Perigonia lusca single nucleopolyhedrovirus TaxID=1675865 RepID=A0A0M3WN32_9ABAC|nr:Methyltransferase 1 [Perigonia lusca single nucleopolyhedrovirus]AKN80646.1 Methyltransferase 1 [Perigonia lusca single nucleopolyhedrovirus]